MAKKKAKAQPEAQPTNVSLPVVPPPPTLDAALPVKHARSLLVPLLLLLATMAVAAGGSVWLLSYDYRLAPRLVVGGVSVGGLTVNAAQAKLENILPAHMASGLQLSADAESATVPIGLGENTDQIAQIDLTATLARALQIGQRGSATQRLLSRLRSAVLGTTLDLSTTIDAAALEQHLRKEFGASDQPAANASLVIDKDLALSVQPEKTGTVWDYAGAVEQATAALRTGNLATIALQRITQTPAVTANEARDLLPQLEKAKALGDLVLRYGEQEWHVAPADWLTWVTFGQPAGSSTAVITADSTVAWDVFQKLDAEVSQPKRDAVFTIADSRVTEFSAHQDGQQLNIEKTLQAVAAGLQADNRATLAVEVDPARQVSDLNAVGIKEIIGVGHSNFAGSPKNRRHNIAVGAAALDGVMVQPGEEFSLVKTLGDIDKANGYLPELVIKGNRTVPEDGGGLCQIGTTLFRAALDSGIFMTERRSHSYRVRYYEPAGTDCTIYNPHPDCRFVNDTGHALMIKTRIEDDDVYFEFWGTRDGRTVEQTAPKIYNVVPPPAAKLVETTDLAPGQKVCSEKPHSGADAEFTYTVRYANGTSKTDVIRSHYKPWQEVCLVGVESLTPETPSTN